MKHKPLEISHPLEKPTTGHLWLWLTFFCGSSVKHCYSDTACSQLRRYQEWVWSERSQRTPSETLSKWKTFTFQETKNNNNNNNNKISGVVLWAINTLNQKPVLSNLKKKKRIELSIFDSWHMKQLELIQTQQLMIWRLYDNDHRHLNETEPIHVTQWCCITMTMWVLG